MDSKGIPFFFAGLAAGALVGTAAAVLLAPQAAS